MGNLWYFQHSYVEDTTVYHWDSDIIFWCAILVDAFDS